MHACVCTLRASERRLGGLLCLMAPYCAGMIGCGLSETFGQLLAWRWVTGVGSALQMCGAQLFLTDISLSTNRARTLGTNQVGPACASA